MDVPMESLAGTSRVSVFDKGRFIELVKEGDVEKVREYLQRYGDIKKNVNCHSMFGITPLHNAVTNNDLPMVALLIYFQADPNVTTCQGQSPLHYAVIHTCERQSESKSESNLDASDALSQGIDLTPDTSIILHLLSNDADVNAKQKNGYTPLLLAIELGNEVAIKELLSSEQCNIEACDKRKMTALHMAAYHDKPKVVRMLIDKGAQLMCEDMKHRIPLHYACVEGSLVVVKFLLDAELEKDNTLVKGMVRAKDSQENTPLHLAVENGWQDIAELCLKKGAIVNAARVKEVTPLHLAAIAGELALVNLLVFYKAKVNVADIMGKTPLDVAVDYDQHQIVKYLLEKGAHINRSGKNNSPLILAAIEGNPKTIKMLLNQKANIFDVDNVERTALFLCAELDYLEALKVFLEHPKAKELRDKTDGDDNTPLHVAAQNGFVPIVKELLDAGSNIGAKNKDRQTPVHLAAKNGQIAVVCELMRRNKAVIRHEDKDSNTALHFAALGGHNKVIKQLIDSGSNINACNSIGMTPLGCAATKGWRNTVAQLLNTSAELGPSNELSDSALLVASGSGYTEVVKQLMVMYGVKQRDKNGCNCLDRAVDGGHKNVVMAIINSKHWKEALMNETTDPSGLRQTPIRKLIKRLPDVAELVFTKCITSNDNQDDSITTYNYVFLDDMYYRWQEKDWNCVDTYYYDEIHLKPNLKPYTNDSSVLKNNHPLMIMVQANQKDLLAHPLVRSLLEHKWNSFASYFYFANLIVFGIYLTFLTAYMVVAKPPYLYYDQIKNASSQLSQCEKIRPFYQISSGRANWWFIYSGKYVVIITAAIIVICEIFHIFNLRQNYPSWGNLIEWLVCVTSFLFVIDLDECQKSTGIRTDWQWQLGSLAIFFSWLELVLFLRKLPRFGIYVVMFTDVLRSFVSFMPILLLFIVAFALSFHSIFQTQDGFHNFWHSLMKTVVMMIGEFEYENTFYPDDPMKMPYKEVSYIIFAIFLIVMSITIMNLLGGLAVEDIKTVKAQAELKRTAMRVEHVLDIESFLPEFICRKFVRCCRMIKPNQQHCCRPINWCRKLYRSSMSSTAITKALNPELYEIKQLQESQKEMNINIDHQNQMLSTMMNRLEFIDEIEQLQENQVKMNDNIKVLNQQMTALLKHHKVNLNEEDCHDEGDQ